MKRIAIILFISTIVFCSCTDNKKQLVDNYLLYLNNYDNDNLSSILDENFSIIFLEESSNKTEFLNYRGDDTIFLYQTELLDYEIVNDSIIETIEMSGNVFQNRTNLIPKYTVEKSYVILDNKICKIYSDTLSGTSEISKIISYVMSNFVNWMIENNIDIDTDYSKELLINTVDKFYASYPLNEIIESKKYLIDEFIEFLKTYEYNDGYYNLTYEEVFNKIAGLQGNVSWKSFVPEKYSSNPNIKAIEIFIDRNKEESEYQTIKLQYLVNPKNNIAELKYGEINGKAKNILDVAMTVGLLLDSGAFF